MLIIIPQSILCVVGSIHIIVLCIGFRWWCIYPSSRVQAQVKADIINIDFKADIRGSLNKFPHFFRMGTFIDNTRMKLKSPSK